MNTDSTISANISPPPEKTSGATSEETTYTDPGPVMDEPANQLDWSNLEDCYQMIAEAAYYKAEQRGFELSKEVLDWLRVGVLEPPEVMHPLRSSHSDILT